MVFTASSVGAAQALKEALRNKTAGQIVRDSRATLIAATHRPSIVALFLDNPNYTPADMLVMAAAFEKIHAQDSALFLAQCASAKDRTQAYHYRLQAEMYAGLKAALSFDHFVAEGQFIAMQLRDKRFVWAVPADYFVWTADNEGTVSVVGHALNAKWAAESATKNTTTKTNASSASASKSQKKKMILVVTGDFTAEARKELAKNGWEPARMTLLATPAEPSKN
jgi:hypothetical protein